MKINEQLRSCAVVLIISLLCSCGGKSDGGPASGNSVLNAALPDLERLTFKENVMHLLAGKLDTAGTGFHGNNYEVFREKDTAQQGALSRKYFFLGVPRYFFTTIEQDSIARFGSVYLRQVGVETDADKRMLAVRGIARTDKKETLDSIVSGLLKRLGKTTEQTAMAADDQVQIDSLKARGMTEEDIRFLGLSEGSQYDPMDYADDGYFEWQLKDRYIQLSLSKDREIGVGTSPEDNYSREYYYLEFLVIRKEEYDTIAALQYNRAVRSGHESEVLKPYILRSLSPQYNWRLAYSLRKAWGQAE